MSEDLAPCVPLVLSVAIMHLSKWRPTYPHAGKTRGIDRDLPKYSARGRGI